MAEIWQPQTLEIYKSWAQAIMNEASDKLNDWESTFLANIEMRLYSGYNLTEPQATKLEEMYTKHTS